MFAFANNDMASARKRARDVDDDEDSSMGEGGFSQHRAKRTLALRISPDSRRQGLSCLANTCPSPRSPSIADITPAGSDSEEAPKRFSEKSAFSPWSSSPNLSQLPSSQISPYYGSSQQMLDVPLFSQDDMDMGDSQAHNQPSSSQDIFTTSSRVSTPINAQFLLGPPHLPAHFERTLVLEGNEYSEYNDYSIGQSRRLPSPISEGETTPSRTDESEDVLMDMDTMEERSTPTPKRGHSRSKHSLRNWMGFSPEPKSVKKFSMGYKSDCEKCQQRVPGHFSHIITYPNGYA